MASESLKRAVRKYQKEKVKQINVKFYPADEILLEKLQAKGKAYGSLNGYIKDLIKKDLEP